MLPLAAMIPAAQKLWASSKWIILVGVLVLSHYYAYSKGVQSVYKGIEKGLAKQVVAESKKGTQAVLRASEDTSKIKDLERENEILLGKLETLVDRTKCSYSDDELDILQQVVDKTKRN